MLNSLYKAAVVGILLGIYVTTTLFLSEISKDIAYIKADIELKNSSK